MTEELDEESLEFARRFNDFIDRMRDLAYIERVSELKRRVDEHLGVDSRNLSAISQNAISYNHVNLQLALEAWLSEDRRSHELIGVAGYQRHYGSLHDMLETVGPRIGSPELVDLPSGLDQTKECVNFGVYLIRDGQKPMVVLMRGPDDSRPQRQSAVTIEILTSDSELRTRFLADISELIVRLNIFRGQMISFGQANPPFQSVGPVIFHHRPEVAADQVVLPEETLQLLERQVFGIAASRDRLLASGQHIKRGILLHGPPGCGKTHTVRYLVSRLPEHTIVLLTGGELAMIGAAASLARMLQPAVVILEDVDLVAQHRQAYPTGNPILFEMLNQLEGIQGDFDVTFLLTTNRADLLEPALAARPGRVDLALEVGLPDEEGRRRLIELYGRGLDLRLENPDLIVSRTEGVTGAFIKELMRKAALAAAERAQDGARLTVTDDEILSELDDFLSEKSLLTRALLGGQSDRSGGDPRTGWLMAEPGRPFPN